MNKLFTLLAASAFVLIGCDSKAQDQTSASVGNPDSMHIMTVEEGYVVEQAPASMPAQPAAAIPSSATVVDETTFVETPEAVGMEEDMAVMPNE